MRQVSTCLFESHQFDVDVEKKKKTRKGGFTFLLYLLFTTGGEGGGRDEQQVKGDSPHQVSTR